MELRCLAWGHVLLLLVYDFVRRFIRDRGTQPPFTIPKVSFVKAALAMSSSSRSQSGGDRDLYLLEQCIGASEGKFRKYINNRATIPTEFDNLEDNNRAEFLAFTQHYQYYKTHKMVFVSDYQGTFCSHQRLQQ
jgi:hypothetical protein